MVPHQYVVRLEVTKDKSSGVDLLKQGHQGDADLVDPLLVELAAVRLVDLVEVSAKSFHDNAIIAIILDSAQC